MLRFEPFASALGASVHDTDLSRPLSDTDFERIHDELTRYGVLFFEDQVLSPVQQVAFARRFGEIQLHPHLSGLPQQPEVMELLKEPEDRMNFGEGWHSDQMYLAEPSMGTCLYAKEIPPVGGDTLFACMRSAFRALSPGMQRMLRGLEAVQQSVAAQQREQGESTTASYANMRVRNASPDETAVVHPLVRVHPVTGDEVLYLGIHTTGLRGFSAEESRPLLDYLLNHVTRTEFCCRFRWSEGALALWDNRRVLHNAMNDYHGYRRLMHRVSMAGDKPIGSSNAQAA
jgi:taurine dioxygenase